MKYIFILILAVFTIVGCSSSRMIQEYKNPDTFFFEASKVLVIGFGSDMELRTMFEKQVVEALGKQNIRAVKSIDFFESSFTTNKKSKEELNKIEKQLLEAGFDAILLTKITGKEDRFYATRLYSDFMTSNQTFEDYYYGNQYLYHKDEKEDYVVYKTETSLYCICPDKERELLWRGEIEVKEAKKVKKSIGNYTTILLNSFIDNELLIYK